MWLVATFIFLYLLQLYYSLPNVLPPFCIPCLCRIFLSQPLELAGLLSTLFFRQSNQVASTGTLYAATHTDLSISSISAYTNLNHAESAVLSPALHMLKHNAVIGI